MPKVTVKKRYAELHATKKALVADCEMLLSRFQESGSVRFEMFIKAWQELKFHQIFCGTKGRQAHIFSRMVLEGARTFFLPPFSFQIRVGGLYLLYGLYHSQSASPREQIRLALREWEDVKKFEKDATDAQHHDAVYILRLLMAQKAFYFTAMPSVLAFRSRRETERKVPCEKFIQKASRPQELITNELLEEMSNIHDIYVKLKDSALSGQEGTSVNLIQKDLIPQLCGSVVDFYKWQQRTNETEQVEESGEGTSSQQDSSKRARLLATIKSKAYEQPTEAVKSRRHRQVEVDLSTSEPKPKRSRSKVSLRSKTARNSQISDDVRREFSTATRINRLTALDFAGKLKPRKKPEPFIKPDS